MNTNVVIKHCPVCPEVANLAQLVSDALGRNLGVCTGLRDGAKGEFTVLVNGSPVIEESSDTLPAIEDVLAAVRDAHPEALVA
jgi:hypothetical protein